MKYNLIFTGIRERQGEDCEETLLEFLKEEMKLEENIPFANVHRIGSKNDSVRRGKPRGIIAKFPHNKDIMKVKKAARNLKGKKFYVNEQHPTEIEDRRKKLYPLMKEARKNRANKVIMVRDKLYVNHVQVIPEESEFVFSSDTPHRPPRPRHNKRQRVGSSTGSAPDQNDDR
ncbi:hypothetical protein FSP39_008307 [Pinctada imbricata]|uniref:Uncharacterized protein n=1 Tax=Pinctada imbricata TaxID=66713 RepID=A0AA88XCZ2_PINIB|nr:hypothetical protein FSP39_008307 [Pinctada imbricata]